MRSIITAVGMFGLSWGVALAGDLHDAAKKGNVGAVQELLDQGQAVDQKDNDGRTALHYAAYAGHLEIISLLLKNKADINANAKGLTPLAASVSGGQAKAFSQLLGAGADWKAKDANDGTLLHIAAEQGQEGIAARLIELGAALDARAVGGITPLHTAAVHGKVAMVKLLLENKAAIDLPDERGRTALHWAAIYGQSGAVDALLHAKAPVAAKDERQRTPLHYAAEADVSNALGGRNAMSIGPFEMLGVSSSYERIASSLLQAGADPNAKDRDGQTPLRASLNKGWSRGILTTLLSGGADPSLKANDGKTASDVAQEKKYSEALEIIADAGRRSTATSQAASRSAADARESANRVQTAEELRSTLQGAPSGPRTRECELALAELESTRPADLPEVKSLPGQSTPVISCTLIPFELDGVMREDFTPARPKDGKEVQVARTSPAGKVGTLVLESSGEALLLQYKAKAIAPYPGDLVSKARGWVGLNGQGASAVNTTASAFRGYWVNSGDGQEAFADWVSKNAPDVYRAWWLFLDGNIHRFRGPVTLLGIKFTGDEQDPLTFVITPRGYVYLHGKGSVTKANNETLRFPPVAERDQIAPQTTGVADAELRAGPSSIGPSGPPTGQWQAVEEGAVGTPLAVTVHFKDYSSTADIRAVAESAPEADLKVRIQSFRSHGGIRVGQRFTGQDGQAMVVGQMWSPDFVTARQSSDAWKITIVSGSPFIEGPQTKPQDVGFIELTVPLNGQGGTARLYGATQVAYEKGQLVPKAPDAEAKVLKITSFVPPQDKPSTRPSSMPETRTSTLTSIPQRFQGTWIGPEHGAKLLVSAEKVVWVKKVFDEMREEVHETETVVVASDGGTLSFTSRTVYSKDVFFPKSEHSAPVKVTLQREDGLLRVTVGEMKIEEQPGVIVSQPGSTEVYKLSADAAP